MTPSQPFCATHPDAPSTGTCARCGVFACTSCLTPLSLRRVCERCVARQTAELPGLEGRTKWAAGALAVTGATSLTFWASTLLTRGETAPLPVLLRVFMFLVALALLPAHITTIVLFCRWFHLAVRQANALGIEIGATPAGAVGSWFIPLLNLVRPFEYTRSLLNCANGRIEYVTPWQVLWIVWNLMGAFSARFKNDWLSLGAVALQLAAAFYAIRLVREVTRALRESRSRVSP
jgi:hypothetical protein